MIDQARLKDVYEAGRRRDYDFNNRDHYRTTEEADAFNRGLRTSQLERPIEESRYRLVRIENLLLHDLRTKLADPTACLLECERCHAIADEADCKPTEKQGERLCPLCRSNKLVVLDEDRLDDQHPWRACEKCDYSFLMDDALGGGGEAGSYICPKCGHLT